jgi:hypothetical protein
MRWLREVALLGGFVALIGAGMALAQDKLPVPAPGTDKFASPPGQAGAAAIDPGPGPVGSIAPGPGDKFDAAPPAVAGEPPALAQFRALIGPGVVLTYRSAEQAGEILRLTGATLRRPDGELAAAELTLDRLRPDGIAAFTARDATVTGVGSAALAIGRIELRDLAVTLPDPGSDPGETPRPEQVSLGFLRLEAVTLEGDHPMVLNEVVVEDYRPGQPGRASLAGLDVLMPEAGVLDRLRIGRITLSGLDFPATVAALTDEATPPRPPTNYALAVEEVRLTQGDQPIGSLGALRVMGVPDAGGIDTGRVTLEALRLEPFPAVAKWLERLDYAALTGDFSAETRFDAAAGRLELVGLLFGVRDAAALGLSVTLDGVTTEAAEAMDFDDTKLVDFALRYLDQSLLRRLAAAEAGTTRRTERQIRDGWAGQAAGALGGGGPVLAAVQRLLRGQAQQLDIIARPPEPVPVGELPGLALGGAAAAQRRLGVTATAR